MNYYSVCVSYYSSIIVAFGVGKNTTELLPNFNLVSSFFSSTFILWNLT